MPSQAEVFEKVKVCLIEALGVDDDEVTPDSSIMGDLGAESIDWLDIVFRLERSFSIKIPHNELSPEDILTNVEYVQDGKVTAAGLDQLKKRMPYADLSKFAASPEVQNFPNLLTVQDMVRYVESKLS
ncbi:MAG: acyl carrier protein [Planctomycetota bacterium]|nr:acyl carrier protein [Planctomycetota bacterium]